MDLNLLESDKIRITSLGRYHIYSLVNVFQYLDAAIIDTPIIDDNVRDMIEDVTEIDARLERTNYFLNYLDNCVKHIQDQELRSAWAYISKKAKRNIREIRSRSKDNKSLELT